MLIFLFFYFFSVFAQAQTSTYVSNVDTQLTIHSWTLFNLTDNLDGIYAKPLQAHLRALMEDNLAFKFQEPAGGFKNAPEEFEEKPALAMDFLKQSKADAFLAGRIAKGPAGISIRLAMFNTDQGFPIGIESKSEIKAFETEDLKRELTDLYNKLIRRLPYRGFITSRRGFDVTLNIGRNQNLKEGQEIYAVQITNVQRHPKFGFLINADKEIMGKIRITKVENSVSFGMISAERTEGLLKAGFKVTYDDMIDYPDGIQNPDSQLAFGQNPHEWAPLAPPTFGKLALMAGLGNYAVNNNLRTAGSSTGGNNVVPSVHVEGEMWLSPNWFLDGELHEYTTFIGNSLAGSSPSKLSLQTQEWQLMVGYNFLATEEFWGPKLQLLGGLSEMDSKIDDSTPTSFTSVKYGGPAIGFGGSMPVGKKDPIWIGGRFIYFWHPHLDESPVTSGTDSSNSISDFSLYGEYQTSNRLAYKTELMFHQYSSNLSGTGTRFDSATSITHNLMTLTAGLVFLF